MRISLQETAEHLKSGRVAAVPTETVYGLAASLYSDKAIKEVFELKGRPSNNPLIIHVSTLNQITDIALNIPPDFSKLFSEFCPGPLTVVLPINPEMVPSIARAGMLTGAFRIPRHPLALQLIELTGPIVMPSANISGRPSATCAEHVEIDFGSEFPVLDGGRCQCGLESTIITYIDNRWHIIRLGSISAKEFHSVLGYVPTFLQKAESEQPLCPGQLYRHYAPKAKLTLKKSFEVDFKGVIVGFKDRSYPVGAHLHFLGFSNQPLKVAENLYSVLRALDEQSIATAFVDIDIPKEGLWATIFERLFKASN